MASTSLLVSKQHSRLADFVTLTKPGVMMLAVFTAIVGLTIAPGDLAPLRACLAVLAIAAGAGAAGVLNMCYDADIDAAMRRTRGRPVPAGRVQGADALALGITLSLLSVLLMGIAVGWLAGGLLVYYLGYSIHSLSHAAWASSAASQYHERSRVFGAVQATSTLGAAAIPLIPFLAPSGGGVPTPQII